MKEPSDDAKDLLDLLGNQSLKVRLRRWFRLRDAIATALMDGGAQSLPEVVAMRDEMETLDRELREMVGDL